MQFNTYTVAGADIAVWLVNHPVPEAAALSAELRRHEVHDSLGTAADAAALRPWTARLREVFEATAVADKARLADALLVAADCRPRLVSHGGGKPFHFHYAPVETGLAARVRALTAAGLGHVVDGGAGARLRVCDRPGCGVAFIDTSRNGRRRFCCVRCANQVNVANHRRRGRAARPAAEAVRPRSPGKPYDGDDERSLRGNAEPHAALLRSAGPCA
jgi:predicted RNA-binding Zn ribbon-like protein